MTTDAVLAKLLAAVADAAGRTCNGVGYTIAMDSDHPSTVRFTVYGDVQRAGRQTATHFFNTLDWRVASAPTKHVSEMVQRTYDRLRAGFEGR